jgi:hypothetical protein
MKKPNKVKYDALTTLKVDRETHARIKQYCNEHNYWMHMFVENVMNEYMDNHPFQKL